MLDSLWTTGEGTITIVEVAISSAASLAMGLIIALVYMFRNNHSKTLAATIALLPVLVQSVIMVVNGSLGAGVAVMGAFNLVRFRSAPGSAKELACIFFAMAVGLAAGMGYVVYALLFTVFVSAVMLALVLLRFGQQDERVKTLKVMIPEDTDYSHLFDDLFSQYAEYATLNKVRTTNLGGLYELHYTVKLKQADREKELLDQIRQRNGNLSLICGQLVAASNEL